jgi:hypothetical protein
MRCRNEKNRASLLLEYRENSLLLNTAKNCSRFMHQLNLSSCNGEHHLDHSLLLCLFIAGSIFFRHLQAKTNLWKLHLWHHRFRSGDPGKMANIRIPGLGAWRKNIISFYPDRFRFCPTRCMGRKETTKKEKVN